MDASTSFVQPNFIGKERFYWWIGQVEKSVDTAKNSNRVKVRIVGHHSDRKSVKPDELPWAQILMPPTQSQISGQGTKSMLVPGQWVLGFFMDGDECQIPIVWGCLGAVAKADSFQTVPGKAFLKPENLYGKPLHVKPETIAKSASVNSVDPNSDTVRVAPLNTAGGENGENSDDDFENVDDGKTKGIIIADDPGASKGQVAQKKDETYKVAIADGVCATEASKDHMLTIMSEFVSDLEGATQVGERWINAQTGQVLNMTNKIQNYSNIMGNMMQAPMGAIMKYTESKIAESFPDIYKAAATANPFELNALKGELDGVLGIAKCAFQSGLLNGLANMFKKILNDLFGSLGKVVNDANCLLSSIADKLFGGILDKINGILNTVKGALGKLGGALGAITGIMNKVLGFAKQALGILSCVNPGVEKCVRSKLHDTKSGDVRPKALIPDIKTNPNLDNRLAKLAGGPTPICDEATTDKTNTMDVVASAFGIGINPDDGLNQIGEPLCGFLPVEVITAFDDGTLDLEGAVRNSNVVPPSDLGGLQEESIAVQNYITNLGQNIQAAQTDPSAAFKATQALSDIGLLSQFTQVTGYGPEYGIQGKLKSYFPLDKKHKVTDLDNTYIIGSWVRTCGSQQYFFQVAGSSTYKPKVSGEGSGAWIELPIDKDGYPNQDAIVYDGGSGYGNGANNNCAPDAFISTPMYNPETDEEVRDYYLKGTAFVDDNGSISAVSFNNEHGYVFRENPIVSVTPCGGDVGDPSSNEAVKDPNTLTNQTDSTLVVYTGNKGVNGVLQGFGIQNVGNNYSSGTEIIFTGGGKGSGASAEPVIIDGRLTDIKITNSGSGYTEMMNILVSDTLGSGASAKIYPIIRYMSSSDPDLVKKLEAEKVISVIDCP